MIEGKITRISGPIVYAEGLDGCGLYDVVDVGNKKLIGEIIRQNKGNATIQVYEEDTGMSIGEPVVSTQRPLSLRLGPGVVGNIYDGIQRPLQAGMQYLSTVIRCSTACQKRNFMHNDSRASCISRQAFVLVR